MLTARNSYIIIRRGLAIHVLSLKLSVNESFIRCIQGRRASTILTFFEQCIAHITYIPVKLLAMGLYNFVKGIPNPTVEEVERTYSDLGEFESTFESRHRVLGGKNPPKLDGLAPYAIIGYSMVEDYITYMDVDPNETTRETLEKSLSILPGAKFKKVKNSMDAIDHVNTATNLVQDGQKVKKMTDLEQNELKEHIEKLGKGTDIVKVPQKVNDVLDEIIKKNGTPPGGKPFENSGKNGGQVLPKNTTYKEYDVNPKVKGQDRGAERLVIGEDGSAWYTNDHYKTFIKIK